MTRPRLTYFDAPVSRGEECRLALHLAGVDFEDNRIQSSAWPALKEQMPYGALPVLELPGHPPFAQTNAILVLIGRRHGLHPSDDFEAARHEAMMQLDETAPEDWPLPTGRRQRLEYDAGGKAVLRAKVQEFYGLTCHPSITSRLLPAPLPVTLELLSPAMRPVQTTTDLPGFWTGSWQDVRKDMRGRYPKHFWPDDPATAQATTRAKPR